MSSDQVSPLDDAPESLSVGQDGSPKAEDLTGRDRLVGNVLISWAGYFVFVVAGFVMPRLIDRQIGREALGVWDFAWSLIHYFGLLQAGVGTSVNRYVAKHRATHDVEGINRTAASVMCVQMAAGILVALLTAGVCHSMDWLFGARLGELMEDARWVVLFLGLSLAVQMLLGVFVGVVTGCHRWAIHNLLNAGFYAAAVAGMITSLLAGGGLRSLALVYMIASVARDVTRVFVAHRVCPELKIRLRNARWGTAYRRLFFGGKTLLPTAADVLLNQTTNVLILAFLGPVPLAFYCRPFALVRHVRTFVCKFAFVLIPTASSLQARDEPEQLRAFFLEMTRWSYYIAVPMILLLAILGAPLLQIWMGPDYAQGLLMVVMACGFAATVVQEPILSTLQGLNAHGRPGLMKIIGACVAVGVVLVALKYLHVGLVGAALAVVVPLTVVDGVFIPRYACKRMNVSFGEYLGRAIRGPILCAVPYAGWLAGARFLLADRPLAALGVGTAGGMAILSVLYWKQVPASVRQGVLRFLGRIVGRTPVAQT